MYGHLALTRDPCLAEYWDEFHVEAPSRARVFARALKALEAGTPLWVRGQPGSGRDSFVRRLASVNAPSSGSASIIAPKGPLLAALAQALGSFKRDAGPVELAETVYSRLLEGFWHGGPCLLFLPLQEFADPAERGELSILLGLRVMDRQPALPVCRGVGDPPCEGFEVVELELPTPDELAALLRRRLALCGAPGLFDEAVVEVSSSKGYSRALNQFGRRLGQLGFLPADRPAPSQPREAQGSELFSPREVEEVGWLLDAISRK